MTGVDGCAADPGAPSPLKRETATALAEADNGVCGQLESVARCGVPALTGWKSDFGAGVTSCIERTGVIGAGDAVRMVAWSSALESSSSGLLNQKIKKNNKK